MTLPIVPIMFISNVQVELEPNVHEDVVAESNMDELIEEDGNHIDMDEVQSHAYHIHPSSDYVSPLMLQIPSRQLLEATTPSSVPHSEDTSNIVAHTSKFAAISIF